MTIEQEMRSLVKMARDIHFGMIRLNRRPEMRGVIPRELLYALRQLRMAVCHVEGEMRYMLGDPVEPMNPDPGGEVGHMLKHGDYQSK